MHYILFYRTVSHYGEKRQPYREEHLALARAAYERGEILLAGALAEPTDMAVFIFKGDSPAAATEFAKNDPYVKNGLVHEWEVRPWTVVIGEECSSTSNKSDRVQQEPTSQEARVSQRDAETLYNKLARFYDIWGYLTESNARNRALELADIKPGQHVLEVAVGTGLAFVHAVAKNAGGRNVGIDISQGMLSKAEHRLRKANPINYELSLGSASAIREEDNSFDVLLNNYMFDLLDESEWNRVLKEFHRVLKSEGRLVLVNMTFGEKPGSRIYEKVYRLSPSLMGGCRGVRLSGALQQNGFAVHLREYHQQMLFPSEVLLASKASGRS